MNWMTPIWFCVSELIWAELYNPAKTPPIFAFSFCSAFYFYMLKK